MGVLVRNRQAERFVIESSHPLEIADPHEDRLELRIGQWTGHRFRHRVTMGTWESSGKSLSYHTVRMPSASRPLTAYKTIRHDRAVYDDKSKPPSTRWTKRPAASSISRSSARVYARTDAVNSRVPFRSMITWRVSKRPRSRSNDASSRTTVPSSRACQLCDGIRPTRLSRLNSSIRNLPRGRRARAIPRRTSRSSSCRSKNPKDVNIEIAASKAPRNRRRRMSPWTKVGLTPAPRAAFRASARRGAERSNPVTWYRSEGTRLNSSHDQ